MKKYPGNLTIWDALSLSKELREALITILNEPEIYEVHAAEYRELAYETYATTVTFTEEDMLLPSPCHNRPLYMRGYANDIELSHILVDAGVAVNIMPLKTVHSLFLMHYVQDARGVTIAGFNQATEEALGRVEIDLVLGEFAAKVTFYVVETNTSFKALLGRPWIH